MLWVLGPQPVLLFWQVLDHINYVASDALAPSCSVCSLISKPDSGPFFSHLYWQQYSEFKKWDGKKQ